ncbi:branched-chain amino acid ABC transporter permease [Nocardioides sp. dk4132]|uniref:branched-chain amino acid ABC transporter permease n=1 Tax=unclassified Nocardioides TaxID=2615069 RepID=UPI0012955718|nr:MULTISPECIES: branched-chain amino acid ABC transporter permease [unclassified Nocardioides]MQW76415.1 branched-chain amino acid ABC transporter permease [Nocardioides sp. dk4132]QGA07312.1 branched-chain amino acid ABC transporter permease [Nocardioides sp. dk884]
MHTRVTQVAAVTGALLVALMVLLLGAGASPARAAEEPAACQFQPNDDPEIHLKGCLRDQREDPPAPVPGVTVTVVDAAGETIETVETNESGVFDVALPGEPLSNLGKDFTIRIDEDTLPEGSDLRNPDQVELTVNFDTTSDQTVTFPIGDALPESAGKFTRGLQLAVGGLVFSVCLAMAALGLSMIFGTTGLTNFAHGELVTFGALVAWGIDLLPGAITIPGTGWDVTVIVGVVVAFVAGGLFGYLNDRALWRPLRIRGTGVIAMMIVSIGLSIFLRSVYQYIAGGSNHNYSQYSASTPWEIGPLLVTPRDMIVVVAGLVVLVAVSLLIQMTRMGKATRAVADNPGLAASSGINVQRVIALVWTVGVALASMSGALLGVTQGFDFQIGFKLLLLIFAAVVLGGLGTIWGAMIGAFVIGIFVEVSTLFVPAELKYVGALAVLIIVLLIRPQGLLGRAQRIG